MLAVHSVFSERQWDGFCCNKDDDDDDVCAVEESRSENAAGRLVLSICQGHWMITTSVWMLKIIVAERAGQAGTGRDCEMPKGG